MSAMVRRTRSRAKALDSAFPIRLTVATSRKALPGVFQAIEVWGATKFGRGQVAVQTISNFGAGDAYLYFRAMDKAEQCLSEFPELILRDFADQEISRTCAATNSEAQSADG
ncbi:hypothetical protein AUC45_11055 [Erythrobacter sp. YT30]|nr:hypothetical protein AUC45_11055 [Erythrobacter sp. YT30]